MVIELPPGTGRRREWYRYTDTAHRRASVSFVVIIPVRLPRRYRAPPAVPRARWCPGVRRPSGSGRRAVEHARVQQVGESADVGGAGLYERDAFLERLACIRIELFLGSLHQRERELNSGESLPGNVMQFAGDAAPLLVLRSQEPSGERGQRLDFLAAYRYSHDSQADSRPSSHLGADAKADPDP